MSCTSNDLFYFYCSNSKSIIDKMSLLLSLFICHLTLLLNIFTIVSFLKLWFWWVARFLIFQIVSLYMCMKRTLYFLIVSHVSSFSKRLRNTALYTLNRVLCGCLKSFIKSSFIPWTGRSKIGVLLSLVLHYIFYKRRLVCVV